MAANRLSTEKLTVKEIEKIIRDTRAGLMKERRHGDGHGLYLDPLKSGAVSWTFLSKFGQIGLGSLGLPSLGLTGVTLAEARERARAYRKLVQAGIDPKKYRDNARLDQLLETQNTKTFEFCFEGFLKDFGPSWVPGRSSEARVYRTVYKHHVHPIIGADPIRPMTTKNALTVLRPIWSTKNPTALRVQALMRSTFQWAKSNGYRDPNSDNPAFWENLKGSLPASNRVHVPIEHPALDWRRIPAFMAALSEFEQPTLIALRLTILNWTRVSEMACAPWVEFDFDDEIWTIPWERHKNGRKNGQKPLIRPLGRISAQILKQRDALQLMPGKSYISPILDTVIAALKKLPNLDNINIRAVASQCGCSPASVKRGIVELTKTSPPQRSAFIFPGTPGRKNDTPIWGSGPSRALQTIFLCKHPEFAEIDFDVHGFRSTAAEWARQNFHTDFSEPELLRKFQLGHVLPKVQRSYERGQLVEERRPMVEAWEEFCESGKRKVIAFRKKA